MPWKESTREKSNFFPTGKISAWEKSTRERKNFFSAGKQYTRKKLPGQKVPEGLEGPQG